MSPSIVTIDTSDDLDFTPQKSKSATRTLLLAPPSVAAHEEKLRALFQTFDRAATDLHMLDRLSAGLVKLPLDTYSHVLVLSDPEGAAAAAALGRAVFAVLVPAMKTGALVKMQEGQFSAEEKKESVLAGLVQKDGMFEKVDEEEEVAIPLKFGAKKNGAQNGAVLKTVTIDLDDAGDDDEIIDEDTLLTDADLRRPIVQRESNTP